MRPAILAILALTAPARAAGPATTAPGLAGKARAVLQKHCHACHGRDGSVEGGLNYVLDRDKLVARRKVVPGDVRSPLLAKVASGRMPPRSVKHRPTPEEVAVLREWVKAGAPPWSPTRERLLVGEAQVQQWILADLEKMPRRARRFARYFSLVPLANGGASPDELATYRKALSKLINSLSWHPRITVPQPVGQSGLLLRIDLRDYLWDAALWNRVLTDYPYGLVVDTAVSRAVLVNTATRLPVVRADWFVATASRAPLYYDLLQLPTNLADLERQLRVDVGLNIQQERVARAGFNGSGISRNNRILERHDSMNGAYWRTYDFQAVPQNLIERNILLPDRRNIFAYPLGPGLGEGGFEHAGGEAIFNLPNGLQAYVLVNANNVRINKGPTEIVSDPRRPDRAVEAGISCMHCHATGILPKDDMMRAHVLKNKKAFSRRDADLALALYLPSARTRKLMEEDARRHQAAVEKTGNKASGAEVVLAMALRHEADVGLATLAAELGVPQKELLPKLTATENLSRNVGALKVAGATVSRQVVVQAFADLVRELRHGVVFDPGRAGENLPDGTGEADPLEVLSSPANAAAISPDGKLAAVASNDRSVRILDVETGRDLRRCIGHTASVWAVAFSPDGTKLLSGSKDGTVRLWEVETARELANLDAHFDLVSAVAFSPDGGFALSASYDGEAALWDLSRKARVAGFASPEGLRYPHAAAFSADGKTLLVASEDRLLLLDRRGKVLKTITGHAGWVTSALFAGDRVLTGSDDGTARLWDAKTGKELKAYRGHQGPVLSVAWGKPGVLTCGADQALRLWPKDGKGPRIFRKHEAGVCAAAFSPDDQFTLSVGRDAVVHSWRVSRGKPVVPVPPVVERPPAEVKEAPRLRPDVVYRVGGTVGQLLLSADQKWLFYLDRTSGKVGRLDVATMRKAPFPALEADAIALSPGGGLLALRGGVLFRAGPTPPARLAEVARGYDLTAAGRWAFVSGDADEWGDVWRVGLAGEKPLKLGTAWRRSTIHPSADGKSLFISSNGVVPGTFERWEVKPGGEVAVTRASADKLPLGGDFTLTPDGKFAVLRTGAVLRLGEELTPAGRIAAHLGIAFDAEAGRAWLLPRDGGLLEVSYPDWRVKRRWQLPFAAYVLALDAKAKRLYVGGFDARSMVDRPRAKGHGDIHGYDLRGLYEAK